MRWLIYLLILTNLGFFAWTWQLGLVLGSRVPGPVDTSDPVHIKRLLLLKEVDTGHLQPPVRRRDANTADPTKRLTATPKSAAVLNKAAKQTKPAKPAVRSPVPKAPVLELKGPLKLCMTAGPLEQVENDAIIELISWLRKQGGLVKDAVRKEQAPSTYWVYLPPFADAKAAREAMAGLKQKGIKDYVRITGDPMRNAVSLGLYSRAESAERRVQQLVKLGYEPKVQTRFADIRWHQLTIQLPAGQRLDEKAMQELSKPARAVKVDCR